MHSPNKPATWRSRPFALVALALCGVLASVVVGALTNAVNGKVSPLYFVTILGWEGVANVRRASIAQGAFEGLSFGVAFSLMFTVGAGFITKVRCPFGLGLKYLLGIIAGALVCWVLGGLAGMGLASLSPEFCRASFIGVPAEPGPMLRYAWVEGSIRGLEIGGFAAVVLGLVLLWSTWRRIKTRTAEL